MPAAMSAVFGVQDPAPASRLDLSARLGFKAPKLTIVDTLGAVDGTHRDPAYPMNLYQRLITIILETLAIVKGLPELELT
jgi:hypothetical protein